MSEDELEWPDTYFNAGKRTKIESADLTDWFVGYGKDRYCQFEGNWQALMVMATQILSSENTRLVVENSDLPDELYHPELEEVADDIQKYTGRDYDLEEVLGEE